MQIYCCSMTNIYSCFTLMSKVEKRDSRQSLLRLLMYPTSPFAAVSDFYVFGKSQMFEPHKHQLSPSAAIKPPQSNRSTRAELTPTYLSRFCGLCVCVLCARCLELVTTCFVFVEIQTHVTMLESKWKKTSLSGMQRSCATLKT